MQPAGEPGFSINDMDADTSLTGSLGEARQGRDCSSGMKGPRWVASGRARARAALETGQDDHGLALQARP